MNDKKKTALEELKADKFSECGECGYPKGRLVTDVLLELAERVKVLETALPRVEGDNLMITAKPYGEAVGIYIGDRTNDARQESSAVIELPNDTFDLLQESDKISGLFNNTFKDHKHYSVVVGSTTFIRAKKESK